MANRYKKNRNTNSNTSRRTRNIIRKRKQHKVFIISTILLVPIIIIGSYFLKPISKNDSPPILEAEKEDNYIEKENNVIEQEVKKEEVLISIAGDFTLGTDEKFGYANSLPEAFEKSGRDYSYFMKNVVDIFKNDDYTLVNLETTFTDSEIKASKAGNVFFNFKGPKDYVNILSNSSIDGVTISNNHIYDYGSKGIDDTVYMLKSKNIGICGEGYKIVQDIKGIKFGFLGYTGWDLSNEFKTKVSNDINELRNQGVKIVIPYFHWGVENQYEPNADQIALGRFAIDNGADAVIGSHSHVIQTIENYKGKLIAYSMGNFCFGGNFNPSDKRTFILQIRCNFENEKLGTMEYKVIPTMLSSRNDKNDYIPTVTIDDREGILKTLNELSPTLSGKIKDEFFSIEDNK